MSQALHPVLGVSRRSRSSQFHRETKTQNIKVIAGKVLFQVPRECQEKEPLVCRQNQRQLPRRSRVLPGFVGCTDEHRREHAKAKKMACAKVLRHEELK